MVTAIVVKLELGHIAKILDVPSLSGHTHEWMVFVKGADGMVIDHFVEKVVFWLHESYDPPKCVVKHPPYEVRQSGYAGFNILIDIHFKNKSEPKTVRFHYDMFLHMENMPPVNHTRVEMLTFTNPADDFKKRLIRAGGVVKTQEVQTPTKEKKHKEQSDDNKHRHSSKEKYDQEKARLKTVEKPQKSDVKPTKSHGRSEEKRRNSVGDGDRVKKKKTEEKMSTSLLTPSVESRPKDKEKVGKLKIKVEKPNQLGLFSREESIDIKQIKKKDQSKKDETRKDKNSRMESKVKKEFPEKQEKKKKEKKHSPERTKIKQSQEHKQKKRRTMSTSDSDVAVSRKLAPVSTQSDSNSEFDNDDRKQAKKRKKMDRVKHKKSMKKAKQLSHRPERKHTPERTHAIHGDNTVVTDMDICQTPPSDHSSNQPGKDFFKQTEINSYEKHRNNGSSHEKTRVTPSGVKIHIKDVKRKESPQRSHVHEKEKQKRSHRPTPPKKARRSSTSTDRKPTPVQQPPSRPEKVLDNSASSDSSDVDIEGTSDKDFIKSRASPSSSSESLSPPLSPLQPIPQLLLPPESDHDDVMMNSSDDPMSPGHNTEESEKPAIATPQSALSSDSDNGVFDSPAHDDTHNNHVIKSNKSSRENQQPPPLVTVGEGETLNTYPGLTDEIFEQLRELQHMLATITDETRMKKVASIVQKSGHFSMEGEVMDFDLCALDRKTIHKLREHLKVT